MDFLFNLTLTKDLESLFFQNDDFDMYVNIAKDACHALPYDVIQYDIFKKYRIKKKYFPKKLFYQL